MAFAQVHPGDLIQSQNLNQIVNSLNGTAGDGQPVLLVALNDPNNYALTVQNLDPTNCRALLVLKNDGTTLLSAGCNGVTLGSPLSLPAGSLTGSELADGSIPNAKLGPDVARANLLTNGGLEVWQRGNGPFSANAAYTADRWQIGLAGSDTLSVSMTGTNVDTGSGSIRAAACTFTKGSGTNTSLNTTLNVTDGDQFRGRTLSASIRVNTATPSAVSIAIGSDGTGGTLSPGTVHTGGSTWQTLTKTYTPPTDATYVLVLVLFNASCTAYVDNACLVVGSQPANYVPLHPADDLHRCQRYYERVTQDTNGSGAIIVRAFPTVAGGQFGDMQVFKARKAVTPTVTSSGGWTLQNCPQPSVGTAGQDVFDLYSSATVAGYCTFYNNGAGVGWTAEANP